ncbi:collagen binding domain-containing protein [Leifsonia sp. NPDC058194]|uniref:MSCRAMM family protein n=1 Tax=Leifsonia sp. NPDC058194 TaxID=3346374 RepID=UPI0036D951FB
MRSRLPVLTTVAALALLPLVAATPASAATTGLWAGWGTTSPTAYTVQVANTPPMTATVATDSRTGQIGVISGASTWLGQGTPVGAKYGSSQGRSYLNLRPKADNAASPSTTTYSFAEPTPTSGWTFVLGDIDADKVQVRAVGPDGTALTAAQLGFNGGFNYCAPGVAGKPSCTGSATDIPSWDAGTQTLTGNPTATDTNGAAGWFEPNTPISALTFVYTQRSGFPVYQTWFASLARDITGTVSTTDASSPAGATLTLTDANGTVVGTTTSGPDGSYAFPGVQATSGYTVSITPPSGWIADTPLSRPADLSATDAVADFAMHVIVPVAIGGTVRDTGGNPVPGATVQLAPGVTTITGPDGGYLFDHAAVGPYTVEVTGVPAGYTVVTPGQPVTVPPGSETPIMGVDFTVRENPSLGGTVTDAAGPVAGVVISATGPDGTVSTVTGADGTYSLPKVGPGAYTVTVAAPEGYLVSGPAERDATVAATDVTGVDFALAKTGSLAGAVTAGTGPVAGAAVAIAGPDGTATITTAGDGTYGLGDLPPGDYTITLTLPDGYTAAGPLTRAVTITDAGDAVTGQDFAVTAVPVAPTPPAGGTDGVSSASDGSTTDRLADTGSAGGAPLAAAAALLGLGGAALLLGTRRSRRIRSGRG